MSINENPYAAPQAFEAVPQSGASDSDFDTLGLRTVRNGLAVVYVSICGGILSIVGLAWLIAVAPNGGEGSGMLALGVGGALLFSFFGYLIGIGMCIAAPIESNAKWFATAAVALPLLGFLAYIAALIFAANIPRGLPQLIGALIGIGSVVCLLIFMKRLASHIGREEVARRANRAVVTFVISFLLFWGGSLTQTLPPNTASSVPLLIGMLGLLIGAVMYANTVTYLRKAISEALSGAAAPADTSTFNTTLG